MKVKAIYSMLALGLHYVIRITADMSISTRGFCRKRSDYPVNKRICLHLRKVAYRKRDPVVQHVMVRWKRDVRDDHDACGLSMSDLQMDPRWPPDLFGCRMTI